nr:MAG TPA: hypothetical protein [Caudoviricetes sp.]
MGPTPVAESHGLWIVVELYLSVLAADCPILMIFTILQ